MEAKVYKKIRENIMNDLPQESVTFLMSGTDVRKSADAVYPFHANRNFVYATGIEEPLAVLVFDKRFNKEILFLRDVDPFMEKWVGHFMRKEEAQKISGIEDVRYFESFESYFEEVKANAKVIGLDFDHDQVAEEYVASASSMRNLLRKQKVKNIFPILVKNRMVKLPEEVAMIENAIAVTDKAIQGMLSEMKPGANEKDMQARFVYEGQRRHGTEMFDTIVAGGKNATTLHYITNDMTLNNNELVLVDLGICVNHYGADISRTYPINGKFTKRQKEVYESVLTVMKEINQSIKPGISISELNDKSRILLGEACINLGLITDINDVDQYYYHSIGHSLGLDTHDVWLDRDAPLEPGNVITNEPGLYIAEEGIGIRLETDVLVTDTGHRDLAPQIIIEVKEVEDFLANL